MILGARSAVGSDRADCLENLGASISARASRAARRSTALTRPAPRGASEDALNKRVPLSVTQWHLHQNL